MRPTTSRTLDQLYGKVDQILHQNRQPRPQRRSVDVAGALRMFTAPPHRTPHTDTTVNTRSSPTKSAVLLV